MNLMIDGFMVVRVVSFLINLCWFTVSKALDISSETSTVREGGCFWLKPSVIEDTMLLSAVVVE